MKLIVFCSKNIVHGMFRVIRRPQWLNEFFTCIFIDNIQTEYILRRHYVDFI